jgi:hypothetical protein
MKTWHTSVGSGLSESAKKHFLWELCLSFSLSIGKRILKCSSATPDGLTSASSVPQNVVDVRQQMTEKIGEIPGYIE